jgi:hypothetical protein
MCPRQAAFILRYCSFDSDDLPSHALFSVHPPSSLYRQQRMHALLSFQFSINAHSWPGIDLLLFYMSMKKTMHFIWRVYKPENTAGIIQEFKLLTLQLLEAYIHSSQEEEERDCLRAMGMGTWRKHWAIHPHRIGGGFIVFRDASHSYSSYELLSLPFSLYNCACK